MKTAFDFWIEFEKSTDCWFLVPTIEWFRGCPKEICIQFLCFSLILNFDPKMPY